MATAKTKEKETPKTYRPSELATELDVDAKSIRAFLRRDHARALEAKNTSWVLSEELAQTVREHFTPSEDDDLDEV